MYEEALPVRSQALADNGQTIDTPAQSSTFRQSGALSHGDDVQKQDLETPSDIYEEPWVVNLQLPSQGARWQQAGLERESGEGSVEDANIERAESSEDILKAWDGPSGRRRLLSFARAHRKRMAAGFTVMVSLVAVGLALAMVVNEGKISQLSATVDAFLKLSLNYERNRTAAFLDQQRLDEMNKTPPSHKYPSCPEGYSKWRGTYYKAYNTSKNFWHADITCRHAGSTGSLAMPRDAETSAFLISLYRSVYYNSSSFWFGLHDQFEDGSFEWMDGTPLGEYNMWAPGQPNNHRGIEDCVCFSPKNPDAWYDAPCVRRLPFLCQV
ncbi:uncharacterized protein LOC144922752 [Branchiostoma floridae x Branchiostoma belcheri]